MLSLIPLLVMLNPTAQLISFQPNLRYPAAGERTVKVWEGLRPHHSFTQAIVSWNVNHPANSHTRLEVRAHGHGFDSKWFVMAEWSLHANTAPRESVNGQKDDIGDVSTDTLMLKKPGTSLDIRVTLTNPDSSETTQPPRLKLLAATFSAGEAALDVPVVSPAWGKVIDVPQRAQGNYPHGSVLCSATSTSMLLEHWSKVLGRPELDQDVPEVQTGVWDTVYKGAGNWPFNAAYFGSMEGMRGYVARFNSIADLEKWIDVGLPVATSVSFDMLRGKPLSATEQGHLVVLVGFTPDGDPVINDPAFKEGVRRVYRRADFARAWAYSHHTVYLFTPENAKVPPNPDHLWVDR